MTGKGVMISAYVFGDKDDVAVLTKGKILGLYYISGEDLLAGNYVKVRSREEKLSSSYDGDRWFSAVYDELLKHHQLLGHVSRKSEKDSTEAVRELYARYYGTPWYDGGIYNG